MSALCVECSKQKTHLAIDWRCPRDCLTEYALLLHQVHAAGDRCKADRTMSARAADGRRTSDGWALLSTKRGVGGEVPPRDEKVGQPKGLSEYGWGETAYAESSASQPRMGKCWVRKYSPYPMLCTGGRALLCIAGYFYGIVTRLCCTY